MDAVIDKLRKIIAMSDSAKSIGNLAEAEAFATKAQELLLKHKLDMSDVEFSAEELNEPVLSEVLEADELLDMTHKQRQDKWIGILISAVTKANFCRALGYRRSNRYTVVGRASDRQAATELFQYLSKAAIEMAPREALAHGAINTKKSFISAFKLGFASAIARRLTVKAAELKAGAQVQGLIRIDQMTRATDDKFKELFPNTQNARVTRARNYTGYQAGRTYGTAVGINGTKRLGA